MGVTSNEQSIKTDREGKKIRKVQEGEHHHPLKKQVVVSPSFTPPYPCIHLDRHPRSTSPKTTVQSQARHITLKDLHVTLLQGKPHAGVDRHVSPRMFFFLGVHRRLTGPPRSPSSHGGKVLVSFNFPRLRPCPTRPFHLLLRVCVCMCAF